MIQYMEFVLLCKHNRKDKSSFLYYCQWTGNEEQLGRLLHIVRQADIHDVPAQIEGSFVKIPEAVVDLHVKMLSTSAKYVGRFTCPDFEENMYVPAWNYADQLEYIVSPQQLCKYFGN